MADDPAGIMERYGDRDYETTARNAGDIAAAPVLLPRELRSGVGGPEDPLRGPAPRSGARVHRDLRTPTTSLRGAAGEDGHARRRPLPHEQAALRRDRSTGTRRRAAGRF